MSISSVHTWGPGEEVFPSQSNALDNNTTYRLDKRQGRADTLASTVSILPDGSFDFQPGSNLIINSSTFKTVDGYLQINADINATPQGEPLRFGYQEITITDLSDLTLSKSQYSNQTLQFNSDFNNVALKDNIKTIILPDVISTGLITCSYTKLLINNTNMVLQFKTVHGNQRITLFTGDTASIYCDNRELRVGANFSSNNAVSVSVSGPNVTYGKKIYTNTVAQADGTSGVQTPIYETSSGTFATLGFSYNNVNGTIVNNLPTFTGFLGDIFEIDLTWSGFNQFSANTMPVACVAMITRNGNSLGGTGLPAVADVAVNPASTFYWPVGTNQRYAYTFIPQTLSLGVVGGTGVNGGVNNNHIKYMFQLVTPFSGDSKYIFAPAFASMVDGNFSFIYSPLTLEVTQYRITNLNF